MSAKPLIAVTGGTGFVGQRLLDLAGDDVTLRALTRRKQPSRPGVEWIEGALDQPDSLEALAKGADAVIHIAGVINARDAAGFEAGNVAGTAAMIAAAKAVGVKRFIHVSSLAAREPQLSAYGASKRRSEETLGDAIGLDWTIIRPPAVYGPGDRETLQLFRMAKQGLMLLPPGGRLSLVHADDLSGLLLRLALSTDAAGDVLEVDDGRPGGWSHDDFARAVGEAVGGRVRTIALPAPLLTFGAAVDTSLSRLTGRQPKLSFDRARYFCHPDWVVSSHAQPAPELWRPSIDTHHGLRHTADWYRDKGWL